MKRKNVLLTLLLVVVVLATSIGLVACKKEPKTRDPKVLVVGTTLTVDSLNRLEVSSAQPGYNYDLIARAVSQIAAVNKVDGKFIGGVCGFTVSEDDHTVTLTLKDGYKWHDGTPVTIDDLKYTLKELKQDVDYNSFIAEGNSLTYTVNMSDVFLTKVAGNPLYPKHLFEGKTEKTITDEESVIGAGPFKYAGRDENAGTITFEKFQDYPLADKVQFNKVVFKKYGSSEVLALALKKGEIDLIYNYSASLDVHAINALSDSNNVTLLSKSTKRVEKALFFNNQKMTDARVKRAIALSIDYAELREKYGPAGVAPAREGFVGEGIEGYKETPIWQRDLEKAKKLLREAGYSETNKFQFEIVGRSDNNDMQYADRLERQIEETGLVEVTLVKKAATGGDFQQYCQAGNHMASLATITPKGYDFEAGYATRYTLATVTSMYTSEKKEDENKNPVPYGQMLVEKDGKLTEYGEILTAMKNAKTKEEKNIAVGKYQDFIVKNVIVVPFFYSGTTYAFSSKISGIQFDDINGSILNVVTFETLKRV